MKWINKIYFESSEKMKNIPDESVDLIVTSPPYFNVKDYTKDGKQIIKICESSSKDIGNLDSFDDYLRKLLKVWKACYRVLRPNGKMCINVPLMPILKKEYTSHENRDIFDIQSEIQHSILKNTNFYLLDLYIWNRTNPTKKLMFGSYPYPTNFYAQNTIEFITVYVKGGKTKNVSKEIKEKSKLTQDEWVNFTKQIWDIPIPNKSDVAFGVHPAIMPEEIAKRCIKLFSFVEDIILDPFTGSGTTLKVAKNLGRNYVGYELYEKYKETIYKKLNIKE